MRFSSYINNQRCLEWGLNANQGALFDLLNQASSWAEEVVIDGIVYYWVSRNEVIKELPLFYSKSDTVYRHFKDLAEKGLVEYQKLEGKDLIRLTEKGKTWNEFSSDFNPNNSETDPTLGNKSEKTRIEIRKSSDLNPTNNNTNNKNTNDHINKKTTQKKSPVLELLAEFGITGQLAEDFITHRKSKNAPITKTALERLQKQADLAGLPLAEVAEVMIERGWRGFNANWNWQGAPQATSDKSGQSKFDDNDDSWWRGKTIEIRGY